MGRSAECDYPADVAQVPVVMRARTLDSDRASAEIDARVRAARSRQESLYELDAAALHEARPDVLFTQDLCGVCSVTSEEVERACRQARVDPTIVSLSPQTLDDVWGTFERVGEAIGRPEEGRRRAAAARRRSVAPSRANGRRVAVVEWLDPPFLAGLWTPEIVRAAGGTPVGPGPGEVATRTTWSEIAAQEPDLVLLSPCSFRVERTARELEDRTLARQVASVDPSLGAFLADEAFFSRPGPRLVEGIDLVRSLLARERPRSAMAVSRWTAPRAEAAA